LNLPTHLKKGEGFFLDQEKKTLSKMGEGGGPTTEKKRVLVSWGFAPGKKKFNDQSLLQEILDLRREIVKGGDMIRH